MRQNYRIKLGLGYDEAKFNYLNNSQFSCLKITQTLCDFPSSGVIVLEVLVVCLKINLRRKLAVI
jgi:hypothetical protein